MSSEKNQEQSIFDAAYQITDADERARYVREACAGDQALQDRIEVLLQSAAAANQFQFMEEHPITWIKDGKETLAAPGRSDEQLPNDKLPRYKLLHLIGEGGMGAVYLADQLEPIHRRVAVKIIKPGMDTKQVVARFEAERQALAMMDHPNIAKILDGGSTDQGRPFFVMELVRGLTITEYCDQQKLDTRERLVLFKQVCSAVQHAHQKGVIHRDLKPTNILVTENGDKVLPKIIDFGIAKATDQRLTDKTLYTRVDQAVGTPNFMSPEQLGLSSLDVDTRSDIYSLGALLYVLLTGLNPFDLGQTSWEEIRRVIRERDPSKPSTRLASLSLEARSDTANRRRAVPERLADQLRGDLDWIVLKAMEKDRQRRYETANEFMADINRHLANQPILARPPSYLYRTQKAWQRNRLGIAAAAAVMFAILAGTAMSLWQAHEARIAEAAEREQRLLAETNEAKAIAETVRATQNETRARESELKAKRNLYQYHLTQISEAYAQGDLDGMTELLERHWPLPWEEEDLRGLEWYHWWHAAHGGRESTSLVGFFWDNKYYGGGLSLTPDEQLVSFAGYQLDYQLRKPQDLSRSVTHNIQNANDAVTSFAPDGRFLVTGDFKGIYAYGVPNWNLVKHIKGIEKGSDRIFAFSSRSPLLAAGGAHHLLPTIHTTDEILHKVRVWNTDTWTETNAFSTEKPIRSLAINRNGTLLAAGLNNGTISIWDLRSNQQIQVLNHRDSAVCQLAFSPLQDRLVSGCRSGQLIVWNSSFHKEQEWDLDSPVTALAFNREGNLFATGTEQGTDIRIWEFTDAVRPHEHPSVRIHSEPVWGIAFMNHDRELITLNGSGLATRWHRQNHLPYREIRSTNKPINIQYGSTSQATLFLVHRRGAVERWHTQAHTFIDPLPNTDSLDSPVVSPNGAHYAGLRSDGTFAIWETESGRLKHSTPPQPSPKLKLLALGNHGHRLAWDSDAWPNVVVWNTQTAEAYPTKLHGSSLGKNSVRILANGTDIICSQHAKQALIADTRQHPYRFRVKITKDATDVMSCIAGSHDGRLLAIGFENAGIGLYDADSGRTRHTLLGHQGRINALAFSRDGTRLLSGGNDQSVRLWAVEDGTLLSTFKNHPTRVISVDIAPDNRQFASLDANGSVYLWKTSRQAEADQYIDHWLNLGQRFASEGDWESAYRVYEHGIQIDPDSASLHAALGELSFSQRDWKRAHRALSRTIELSGPTKRRFIRRGTAAGYLNRKAESFQDFETAIQLDNDGTRPGTLKSAEGALRVSKALLAKGTEWYYTFEEPEGNWKRETPDSRSHWKQGATPFGASQSPSTVTEWDQTKSDIWLRQSVNRKDDDSLLMIHLRAADQVTVFVNGHQAVFADNGNFGHGHISSSPEQPVVDRLFICPDTVPLHPGVNEIAIHVHNANLEGVVDVSVYSGERNNRFNEFVSRVEELAEQQPRIYDNLTHFFVNAERFEPKRAANYSDRQFELKTNDYHAAESAASCFLLVDEIESYVSVCLRMIDNLGALPINLGARPTRLDRTILISCLHPAAIQHPRIRQIINDYLSIPNKGYENNTLIHRYRERTKAIAHYRQGDLNTALKHLEPVMPPQDRMASYGYDPDMFMIRAAIQHQLGQTEKAQESLKTAEKALYWLARNTGHTWDRALLADTKATLQQAPRPARPIN